MAVSRLAVLSPQPGRFYATLLVNDNPVLFTLLDMSAFTDDDEEWVRSLNVLRNDHITFAANSLKSLDDADYVHFNRR